ncbi:hypothetical protein Fleli_3684 [Bernardetia litoralis DSM 6794]|uniref:Uncharacterized protein n=1 Tax=Bernardetia litoralis (strain ATCC 23117 / DSM 6794 / NBRC 15988 / NCIMB 1366 / Fx l1 / Sio-4) TaxID=880071 RepID=I4APW3_BERLS|nr:hypothetical protein Fleli_3684 [Bernardetia litoralis DSM 6794]
MNKYVVLVYNVYAIYNEIKKIFYEANKTDRLKFRLYL